MSLDTRRDVAMILPLPVAAPERAEALTFHNLEAYPEFFDDLERAFYIPQQGAKAVAAFSLPVQRVGAFDASFVPSIADFGRLDRRFRLPTEVWQGLPRYQSFAFAVFKLRRGRRDIHPMAFTFRASDSKRLFFPTMHIHDGETYEEAEFDHTLYCQGLSFSGRGWKESAKIAAQTIDSSKSGSLTSPRHHFYKLNINGLHPNHDIGVSARRLT